MQAPLLVQEQHKAALSQLGSSQWGRRCSVCVHLPVSSESPVLLVGSFVHLGVLNNQRVCIEDLKFRIMLGTFKHVQQNSSLFFGHGPCFQPHCLAWAHFPSVPLLWQNGIHWFCNVTSFRYLVVCWICIPLMAWAVSQAFLIKTYRFEPLYFHDFVGLSGSSE